MQANEPAPPAAPKPETREEKIARLDRARERAEMEAAFPRRRRARKGGSR